LFCRMSVGGMTVMIVMPTIFLQATTDQQQQK